MINGKPITTTIDIGIKATKTYVSKALGSSLANAERSIAKFYPSNGGALGKWENEFLMEGTEIDRYGSGFGKYFSPKSTPFDMRALPLAILVLTMLLKLLSLSKLNLQL